MPGHHCEYNPTHGSVKTFSVVKDYIKFMNRAHIVRVHPGEYVVVKVNDQYSLLEPGEGHSVGVHMFDDPKFEFVQRVKQTNPAILAGPINIITVPPGRLARILIQNKPYILFEGQHRITSGLLEFGERILSAEDRAERKHAQNPNKHKVNEGKQGFSHLKDTFLYHSIGKVYVKPGEVRGVQVNRRAVFLDEPGDYWFYSDQIEISQAATLVQEMFEFSSLLRVYIKENECGVVQKENGSLEILQNGCHVVQMPNRYLVSMPKTVQFREIRGTEGITLDPMDVVFNFTMAYTIVDPFKAYLVGAQMVQCHAKEAKECKNDMFRTIDNTIRTSCTRSMQEIVRHLVFKDTMLIHRMSKEDLLDEDKKHHGENILHQVQDDALQPGSLKSQFQNTSRGSVKLLAKTLRSVFGVELLVEEFGISKLDLKNQSEQDELNRAAFEAAKARAIIVRAENEKKKALVDKDRVEIIARTKVAERMIDAESRGRITELNSEAKSREIERLAEAEAKAIRVKAEAEGFAKEQFEDRTQLQMAEIISKMFQGTNLTVMDSNQGQIGALLHKMIGGMAGQQGKVGDNPFCLPRVGSHSSQ
jgi:regulator of protease activity HflC (stomatin/prohibitin superfamily)